MTAIQDECGLVADTLTGGSGEGGEKRSESGRHGRREEEEECVWREARQKVGGWLRVGLMPRLNLFLPSPTFTEY